MFSVNNATDHWSLWKQYSKCKYAENAFESWKKELNRIDAKQHKFVEK